MGIEKRDETVHGAGQERHGTASSRAKSGIVFSGFGRVLISIKHRFPGFEKPNPPGLHDFTA
jgi:hypothetical protein